MKRKLSIFDWNGALLEEVKIDEENFGIMLTPIDPDCFMGFFRFEISGPDNSVWKFLNHYDLELDPTEH